LQAGGTVVRRNLGLLEPALVPLGQIHIKAIAFGRLMSVLAILGEETSVWSNIAFSLPQNP
jgi:hypothetical protein